MAKILVVDDEEIMRDLVTDTLLMSGYECESAKNGLEGLEKLQKMQPDLVISDFKMPKMTGLEFLKEIKKIRPDQSFIIMTAFGTIQTAVEVMQNGADDFLEKPVEPDRLELVVKRVLEKDELKKENTSLRRQLAGKHQFIGQGGHFSHLQNLIGEVAPTTATVLIMGESGVGKEVLARSIHAQSLRAPGAFIKINCAALPDSLIESELFGHEKGAFTGALKTKKGKFELAHKGTLLLDEIGEMPLAAQSKLLRVLQEREVSRLGGDEEIAVDVRVICTTNRNLHKEVEEGNFREDLFYRLNVIPVTLAPLRDRKEDIQSLVEYFITRFNAENGYSVDGVSPEALLKLQEYSWPGNIRQLENAVERAMVFCKSGELTCAYFDILPTEDSLLQGATNGYAFAGGMTVAQAEQQLILHTLEECDGNKSKASEILDISIRTLRNKLHEYGEFEKFGKK
jgi:DNA-binding NtrC family response regulator